MDILKKRINAMSGFFSIFLWCLSVSWKTSKFYTAVKLCSEIIVPITTVVMSIIGKYVIDLLAVSGGIDSPEKPLLFLILSLLIIVLVRSGLLKASQYCQSMHDDIIGKDISLMMMERSLSVDLEYFDNPDYYDKLQLASRDSNVIITVFWNVLACISAGVSFVLAFTVMCQANALYAALMIAAAFPSSIAAAKYTKLLYKLNLDQINEERKMGYCQGIAFERQYAQDLRLFNAGGKLKDRYNRIWDNLFTKRRGMTRKRAVTTGLLECLPEIALSIIAVSLAFRVIQGSATVGDYSLYTGISAQLWSSILLLSTSVIQILDNRLKFENIKNLQKLRNRIADDGRAPLSSIESIEFDHVCFAYPGSDARAIDDVCFRITQKEKVALVGINGSGKTTLIKLLLRMYDPDGGVIRVNGRDAKEYKLADLRSNFSVYFQDMLNYSFTIRDNFAITNEGGATSDETVNAALEAADCSDIMGQAVNGLDTDLTRYFCEDGIELSGGQHQKLALARTLFRQHTAIILDEPSSNLDPKAEHRIFSELQRITEGKLTIFTSHRLSNVFLAHRIIVMEKGRVIEDGTQKELLENKHRYAELFRYQQEKFFAT